MNLAQGAHMYMYTGLVIMQPLSKISASANEISTAFISIEIVDIHVADAEILNNDLMIAWPRSGLM